MLARWTNQTWRSDFEGRELWEQEGGEPEEWLLRPDNSEPGILPKGPIIAFVFQLRCCQCNSKLFFLNLSVALVIFKDILHAVGYSLLGTPLKKVAIGWSNTILQSLRRSGNPTMRRSATSKHLTYDNLLLFSWASSKLFPHEETFSFDVCSDFNSRHNQVLMEDPWYIIFCPLSIPISKAKFKFGPFFSNWPTNLYSENPSETLSNIPFIGDFVVPIEFYDQSHFIVRSERQ